MTCRAQDIALNVASKENVTVKEVVKELESVYVDEDNVLMKCDSFDRMIRKPDQSMKEFVYVYDLTLCENNITLEVHVVNTDIPLLLSLKTMKKMDLNIDFESDVVTLNGKTHHLKTSSSGHYTLDLETKEDTSQEKLFNTVSECENKKGADSVKKSALKLHRRFAQANSKRIVELLRKSG
ncbi:hypothetical protein ACHWQZ_G008692 [Mnemiopsis leidyi]